MEKWRKVDNVNTLIDNAVEAWIIVDKAKIFSDNALEERIIVDRVHTFIDNVYQMNFELFNSKSESHKPDKKRCTHNPQLCQVAIYH